MQDEIFKIEKIRGIVLAEKIRDFRVTSVIKARNSRTGTTCTVHITLADFHGRSGTSSPRQFRGSSLQLTQRFSSV